MCGRFSLISISEFLANRFNVAIEHEVVPRYNIAPGQDVSAILNESPSKLSSARWGLVPHWAKDEKSSFAMINARAENLMERPAFKMPFEKMRCLIPADGFYEWKKSGSMKIPFRIALKDKGVFAFAGIYDHWNQEGKILTTCSIITCEPNKVVEGLHDRMPVILRRDCEKKWLANIPLSVLQALLVPYDALEMSSYRVSQLANSSENDSEEIIKPVKSLTEF
jgi:putative SOS response-associated peptidase YedK